jgi:hypothetical protein
MSPGQRNEAERHAREYIDRIIQINRQYGMGSDVPQDAYERAVKGSVEAVSGLISTRSD